MKKWDLLRQELAGTGYYPELVADSLALALGGEPIDSFLVSLETTFEREELLRHLTVAVLTPTRLIRSHTDEFPPVPGRDFNTATAATEAVRLDQLTSVVIERVFSSPAAYPGSGSRLEELVLTVGWGAVSRIDLAPAACDDPQCEADHGLTGTTINDDLVLRVARAADGNERLEQATEFAATLSKARKS